MSNVSYNGIVFHTGFCYINSIKIPYPDADSGLQHVATMVNSGRSISGVVKGEKIGRDVRKVEMKWTILPRELWQSILQELDSNFYFNFRYIDMVTGTWKTRKFYCSDRTAKPFKIDMETNLPEFWADCSVNVIDVGA